MGIRGIYTKQYYCEQKFAAICLYGRWRPMEGVTPSNMGVEPDGSTVRAEDWEPATSKEVARGICFNRNHSYVEWLFFGGNQKALEQATPAQKKEMFQLAEELTG